MKIGFLGTGHIAAPMARFVARKGHDVWVSERNAETAAALAALDLSIKVADNQSVVDASDIVVLCLRPAVWQPITQTLTFRSDQKIVSVMAGVAFDDIAQAVAPASDISSTIPFGFLETGGCPLPVAGDPATIRSLFAPENFILPQSEEKMLQYHFAASSLPSGILEMLEVTTKWLAEKTGDADQAEIYVGNLISGVLNNLNISNAGVLADERNALASPKTLNLQMVEGLRERGAFARHHELLDQISDSMEPDK